MPQTPDWATELLLQVCKDEGRSKKPKISWGVSKSQWRRGSSGHYNPRTNTIRVMAHELSTDQKQVFLHEISHWLTKPRGKRVYFWGERRKKKNWHGKRFYLKLNELLIRYDCFTDKYQKREAGYKSRSVNYLLG